jgi:hypothetical protein
MLNLWRSLNNYQLYMPQISLGETMGDQELLHAISDVMRTLIANAYVPLEEVEDAILAIFNMPPITLNPEPPTTLNESLIPFLDDVLNNGLNLQSLMDNGVVPANNGACNTFNADTLADLLFSAQIITAYEDEDSDSDSDLDLYEDIVQQTDEARLLREASYQRLQDRVAQQAQQAQQAKEAGWDVNKKTQYQQQEAERRRFRPTYIATDEEKDQYYKMLLGDDYKNIEFFDTITQEKDVLMGKYLDEDDDNLIIITGKTELPIPPMFTASRSHVNSILAHYECPNPNSMQGIKTDKLLSLSVMGCPCEGMMLYDAAKQAMMDTNFQIFAVRASQEKTKTLVSHEALYIIDDYTSEAHCQDGTEKTIYQMHMPARY